MKRNKVIVIIIAICIIVMGVFILFKKANQPIEPNFYEKAIEQYWNNEDVFEEAKEYFLTMSDDIYIYRDNDNKNNILAKDGSYDDVEINVDFERILMSLFEEFTLMNKIYKVDAVLYGMDVEDSFIKFELTGAIKPRGIVYIVSSSEEEVKNKLVLTKCQYLKVNWYYYEQPAGV